MRTGVSYLGQHELAYLKADLDHGIRPLALFWGALNLFGGGRSSQFLLEHPEGFQRSRQGTHLPAGCYMNPLCRQRIQALVDEVARQGYAGYFVDEPTPLHDCFCGACAQKFREWYSSDLFEATAGRLKEFRERCVLDYVSQISRYCKENHPHLETLCCLMPHDQALWAPLCRNQQKVHHEWLQCWDVRRGREGRILDQGRVLVREKPDALYVWAWKGQAGTAEACDDPAFAWDQAKAVLRMAKDTL